MIPERSRRFTESKWNVDQLDRALDWLINQNLSYRLAVGGSNPPIPFSAKRKLEVLQCYIVSEKLYPMEMRQIQ